MNLLRVHDAGKAYNRYASEWHRIARWFGATFQPLEQHWVLRHIRFDLAAGESLGIVGRNGAGKSTLLKMITGTLPPSEGTIQVAGRVAAILELGMGFNPEFSGRRNARHVLELMGMGRARIDQALPGIAAFADIGDYFDQPVRTYSTGMQARVAFAAATAIKPDLLIVDEVLSVGDAHFQAKCFERIARYREQGMALILVTHSVADVVAHCDRALLLRDGRLVEDGAPVHVTNLYLDDLFGRASGTARPARATDGESPATMGEDGRDLFHTRPGYRKEEHRWGQGGAVILDYRIVAEGEPYPPRIESGAETEFLFKVRFDADCEAVMPGLLIKTIEGIFLYGTNAFSASGGRAPVIAVCSGDILVFRFALSLALNEGHYLVSFGVSSGDPARTLIPLERRYDSVIITVGRSVPFWGIADLRGTFDVWERLSHD
ncbi:ABC transporter ATP-binding protein [Thiocystis violacea]|uniref:ABC transporter ATP-binding protein n=1 Tax=Thiocystis violacea TaxID=13725 RepID=UPI001F5B6FA5|nr:ABC transporter ATP-binding protein [Thiocystis violacea]MBK1719777.1 ABC transporter ATP-binding protein [Thiocystis violacea]